MYRPTTPLGEAWLSVALEILELFEKKNADYGPGNISRFGEKGVLVRANDKMERLIRLVWEERTPHNEAVEDTWMDLADYAIIALLVRRGLWEAHQEAPGDI